MPKIHKALVVVLPFIVAFGFCFRSASATTTPLSERTLDKADAPVTVIEYASLTNLRPLQALPHQNLPAPQRGLHRCGQGQVRLPSLSLDQVGMMASTLAECVPRIRFFGLIETLFRNHDGWAHSQDPKTGLAQIGLLAGISRPAFEACLADEKLSNAIVEEVRLGQQQHKVNSTPTFIIEDTVIRGVRSYDDIAKVIDKAAGR